MAKLTPSEQKGIFYGSLINSAIAAMAPGNTQQRIARAVAYGAGGLGQGFGVVNEYKRLAEKQAREGRAEEEELVLAPLRRRQAEIGIETGEEALRGRKAEQESGKAFLDLLSKQPGFSPLTTGAAGVVGPRRAGEIVLREELMRGRPVRPLTQRQQLDLRLLEAFPPVEGGPAVPPVPTAQRLDLTPEQERTYMRFREAIGL